MNISDHTLDIVIKIGCPIAAGIGSAVVWYLRQVAKSFKNIDTNIYDIRLKMVEVHARYDGVKLDIETVKKDVHEVKERVRDIELYIYKK